MATPPPNEAVKLAILRQQLMDKIKQDEQYKQMTDRQYTGAIQPNPSWMPKKADGGLAHMDKGGRLPQQTNLDMAREAAERIGQHHDPHTRSLQQGYEHDWYHGSTGDIKSFNPNTRGESTGAASAKKGYFFARDPSTPPPEMLEHDPESLALLQKIGATIPPKPTMAGHGAHTASSYAGTGGSREYKEAMRMAKAAEKAKDWDAHQKYMQMAEDAEINSMRYRQDLVAKHGDARDIMYENIKNAWYGAHNAKLFKNMSQPEYEEHDKRYKELMPYGWHIDYKEPHYKALKAQLKKFGNNKQVQSALDAINHYQSVHNERKASEVESGANVMPVALRYKNPMYHDFKGSSYRDQTYSDLMDEALRKGHDALILKNTFDPGGTGKPKMVDVGVVFHPNQVRSKFAAFDPTRTHESDLLAAKGGTISQDAMQLALMNKGGKPDVRPTVFDDKASRRNEKIEAAARALSEGEMKQKAYEKLVAKEKPVKPYDFIPAPATNEKAMEVLLDRQKQNWRSHEGWPAGHRVGLRLDIPAYERHGVWVNSIHDESGGKDKFPTSYGPVSSVRNAEFQGNPQKGIKVATGEQSKAPFAKIMGDLEHIDEDKAVKHMQKYLNHPDYRQVGYDPRRHGDFYDRETMQPVTHSEHVVQIGPLVLAKKPKYGKRTLYKKGGKVTHAHHLEIEERPL